MARKTGWWALAFLLLVPPLAGQKSPLQWPVPPPGPPRQPVFPRILIGPAELSGLLKSGGAIPFDARGADPYAEGHLPGAVSADGKDLEPGRLAGQGISGTELVAIYGGGGNGDREAVARWYWLLRRAGCAGVRILDGGIAAWRAAGGAVETGAGRRPSVPAFRPAPGLRATADAGWLAESFGQAGVEVLDLRDARGWERWETPPTFAAGHIPYSLPFDPQALLPAAGWPEPAMVRRRLAGLGPRPGDPVSLAATFVLYGDDGRDPRLGLGYLLLTLAGLDVRVFPGGWKEWTAGGARPVVRVVSAAELADLLRPGDPGLAADRPPHGLILLDLREPRDFAIGHLPGALNLPTLRFPGDFEKTVAAGWPGADRATIPLVLYCYGIDCVRSRKAGAQAAHQGFRNVIWFRGGVDEWRQAGYPLFDSPPAPPAPRAIPSAAPASPGCGGARP